MTSSTIDTHEEQPGKMELATVLVTFRVFGYRLFKFDVCVTVHDWYNNINSQLDATMTDFIDN